MVRWIGARLPNGMPVGCVVVEDGDDMTASELKEQCMFAEALSEEEGEEVFIVQFPNRTCEPYTARALDRSFPLKSRSA